MLTTYEEKSFPILASLIESISFCKLLILCRKEGSVSKLK